MRIKAFVTLTLVVLAGGAIMVAGEMRTAAKEAGAHPTLYADRITPAENGSSSITLNASTLWFDGNNITDIISRDYIVGLTSTTYQGDVNVDSKDGYAAAHAACRNEYGNDSHVCSVEEIAASYAANVSVPGSGYARLVGGPPGFTASANDCRGFTSSASGDLGKYWDFGKSQGFLTKCSKQYKLACCGGST